MLKRLGHGGKARKPIYDIIAQPDRDTAFGLKRQERIKAGNAFDGNLGQACFVCNGLHCAARDTAELVLHIAQNIQHPMRIILVMRADQGNLFLIRVRR